MLAPLLISAHSRGPWHAYSAATSDGWFRARTTAPPLVPGRVVIVFIDLSVMSPSSFISLLAAPRHGVTVVVHHAPSIARLPSVVAMFLARRGRGTHIYPLVPWPPFPSSERAALLVMWG